MSDRNNDLESLSRLREIIFGEQMTKLEEEIKNLSSDSKINFERLSNEFTRLLDEKEDHFNTLMQEQKEAFEQQLQKLEKTKADRKKLAETLRNLANSFDNQD
ncbi:MAG: hypothetical protein DRJ09_00425 [Bacteroidetes bacterium]|nr:MAG: hypothetical protein DRJ09_00425 [Bacteroidota bacterium]